MLLYCAFVCLMLCLTRPAAADGPDCTRPRTLALHEHGLLYSGASGEGIDKDFADELIRRSGCPVNVTVLPRARIWQLIETGALDFSLSGITNDARERFAAFAWYFSNRYTLLVRKDAGVTRIDELNARPALRLGAIRSFRYGPTANRLVDRLAQTGRVIHANTLDTLYRALATDHIQAMIIEPFDIPILERARLAEQTRTLEFPDPPIPHGLIMSRAAVSPEEQARWRALVDGMRADGSVERIFGKYFKPDLARAMTRF